MRQRKTSDPKQAAEVGVAPDFGIEGIAVVFFGHRVSWRGRLPRFWAAFAGFLKQLWCGLVSECFLPRGSLRETQRLFSFSRKGGTEEVSRASSCHQGKNRFHMMKLFEVVHIRLTVLGLLHSRDKPCQLITAQTTAQPVEKKKDKKKRREKKTNKDKSKSRNKLNSLNTRRSRSILLVSFWRTLSETSSYFCCAERNLFCLPTVHRRKKEKADEWRSKVAASVGAMQRNAAAEGFWFGAKRWDQTSGKGSRNYLSKCF